MDFHVLTQAMDKKTVNLVFHIPIPGTGVNEAGVQWRSALLAELGGANNITSVLPNISQAELDAMKSGALLELSTSVRFSSIYLDNAQRLNEIKAAYTATKDSTLAEKQITLAFIGYQGDIE